MVNMVIVANNTSVVEERGVEDQKVSAVLAKNSLLHPLPIPHSSGDPT